MALMEKWRGPINNLVESILSTIKYALRIDFSTQFSLIAMLEKWKGNNNKGGLYVPFLTNLSKDLTKMRENVHSSDGIKATKKDLAIIEIDINEIEKALYIIEHH